MLAHGRSRGRSSAPPSSDLKFNLGIECETYIVRRDPSAHNGIAPNDPRDTIPKAAYDAGLTLMNLEFLNEIVSSMNELGWEVHSFDHEDANGQFEFDFAYADVMTMADRFVVWRMMMKELARKYRLGSDHDAEALRRPHRIRRAFQHVAGRRQDRQEHFRRCLRQARLRLVEALPISSSAA